MEETAARASLSRENEIKYDIYIQQEDVLNKISDFILWYMKAIRFRMSLKSLKNNISVEWTFMIIQKYVLCDIKTVLQIQLSHFSFQYNNQFPQQIIRCLYLQFQYALYVEIKDHL